MKPTFIQFKKERELGEIITDTFAFIRQNYKVLFAVLIKVLGPAFLFMILAMGYYTFMTASQGDDLLNMVTVNQSDNVSEVFDFYSTIAISFFVLMLASWFFYSMLFGSFQYVIKSYMENNGTIIIEEVAENTKNNWTQFLGLGFLTGVFMVIGFMLCFFPGIYVMVPLSLVFSIMVFQQKGVSEAISYSFTLIKDNWWITFFTLFIVGILYYIINMIFQLPIIIYSLIKGFVASQEVSTSSPDFMFDWVFLSLSMVSNVIQYILYGIITIATIFIYFNLNEKKNQTGTFEEIESLGKDL